MTHSFTKQNKHYLITNEIKENNKFRNSFNTLATNTFGIDFEPWYQSGFWQEKYIPYAIIEGETVIANVSMNIMDMQLDGAVKRFIQIATVMTSEQHRNQGFSRMLMEHIIEEWQNKCDGFYLFANDSVLNFYPKFGFTVAREHECIINASANNLQTRKLDMDSKPDVDILLSHYRKGNPYSRFSMANNEGLIMFYCSEYMRDFIYFSEDLGLVFIAEQEDKLMICHDIFGKSSQELMTSVSSILPNEIEKVKLGFTPKQSFPMQLKNNDDCTLFVSDEMIKLFKSNALTFPTISHT